MCAKIESPQLRNIIDELPKCSAEGQGDKRQGKQAPTPVLATHLEPELAAPEPHVAAGLN